jgi:hypothetical protein
VKFAAFAPTWLRAVQGRPHITVTRILPYGCHSNDRALGLHQGKSWQRVGAALKGRTEWPGLLPKGFGAVSALSWMDHDPVRDILYAMKMGSERYRLERGNRE